MIGSMPTASSFHILLLTVNSKHYEFLSRTRVSCVPTQLSASLLLSLYLKYTVFYSVHLTSSHTSVQLRLKQIPFEGTFTFPKADGTPSPNPPTPNSPSLA